MPGALVQVWTPRRIGAVLLVGMLCIFLAASVPVSAGTGTDAPEPENVLGEFVPFLPGVGPGSPDDDAPAFVAVEESPLDASDDEETDQELSDLTNEDADEPEAEKQVDDAPGEAADQNAAQKPEAEAAQKQKRPDPVADFFRGMLPAAKPAAGKAPVRKPPARDLPAAPPVAKPNTKTKLASRYVADPRLGFDRRAVGWIDQANTALDVGEYAQAAKLYQQILEQPDDSFQRTNAGLWIPMRRHVRQVVALGPSGLREAYETQVGGLAAKLLTEAVAAQSEELLGRVASRYFATRAGLEAANRLASQQFDRGHVAIAAYWMQELWDAKAPVTRDVKWRMKAAVALKRAGLTATANQVIAALDESGQPLDPQALVSPRPAEWLTNLLKGFPAWSARVVTEWPVPFGDASRSAQVLGGEPLLVPRWTSAISSSRPVLEQIDQVVQGLHDQGAATFLAGQALTVRGRVIHRTLAGVRVVDAATGRVLWQTEDDLALEESIAAVPIADDDEEVNLPQPRPFRMDNGFQINAGQEPQSHPLANLLFRNAGFGMVSTYESQLFVLTDRGVFDPRQPGQPQGWDGRDDAYGVGNLLRAYDLETGRILWELGGERSEDGLELPLAGSFFFGPPLAVEGELLVVAEQEKDVRLLALSPADGRVVWSLLLGHSDSKIEVDLGRRWWTAPVAYSEGVIICPTTTGWTMAVDRASQSLLWGVRLTRLPKPGESGEGSELAQPTPLAGRWQMQAPVIAGNRVFLASPESQELQCVDLLTGKVLWKRSRDGLLALEGVHGNLLITLGSTSVIGLKLTDGSIAWTAGTGLLAGRGVLTNGQLYVPVEVNGGGLRRIDLATGALSGSWRPQGPTTALGHLGMYQGLVLAYGPQGVTAFEQADSVRKEIAARKQTNPNDPGALLREAQFALVQDDFAGAVSLLDRLPREALAADDAATYRRLYFTALVTLLRSEAAGDDLATPARFAQLGELAESRQEVWQARELEARSAAKRGDVAQAAAIYLDLCQDPIETLDLSTGAETLTVSGEAWLAGRLADLRTLVPADKRADLETALRPLVTFAADLPLAEQARRVRLVARWPVATEALHKIVDQAEATRDFALGMRLLSVAREQAEPREGLRACQRTARFLESFELIDDALAVAQELRSRFATTDDGTGQTGEAIATEITARLTPRRPARDQFDWEHATPRIERVGVNYANDYRQDLSGLSPLPWFRRTMIDIDQQEQRLSLADATTGARLWTAPLRSKLNFPEQTLSVAEAAGYTLVVLHRGVLHGVSGVDRRILWTRMIETRSTSQGYYLTPANTPYTTLSPQVALGNRLANLQTAIAGQGALLLATPEVTVYSRQRFLTCLDTLTGEHLWTRGGFRPGTQVFGDGELLFLRAPEGQKWQAIRACDGREQTLAALGKIEPYIAQVVGHRFLLLGRPQPDASAQKKLPRQIELYDAQLDQTVWRLDSPTSIHLSPLEAGRFTRFDTRSGRLEELELETGRLTPLGELAPADRAGVNQSYAIADGDQVYLLINTKPAMHVQQEGMPCLPMSGRLFAFGRAGGGQRWRREISTQSLIVERFAATPLLVFAARRFERRGGANHWMFRMLTVDKQTGALVTSNDSASTGGFRNLLYEPERRAIELRSYSERLRLVPAPALAQSPSESKPPTTP